MGWSNCSEFLPPFTILGWIRLIVSWFPKRAGETEVLLKLGIWELNLELVLAELTSLGVMPSLSVWFTFPGVRKMRTLLRAAFVTFAFRNTV